MAPNRSVRNLIVVAITSGGSQAIFRKLNSSGGTR